MDGGMTLKLLGLAHNGAQLSNSPRKLERTWKIEEGLPEELQISLL
jgi:hypothetical protein